MNQKYDGARLERQRKRRAEIEAQLGTQQPEAKLLWQQIRAELALKRTQTRLYDLREQSRLAQQHAAAAAQRIRENPYLTQLTPRKRLPNCLTPGSSTASRSCKSWTAAESWSWKFRHQRTPPTSPATPRSTHSGTCVTL